MALKAQIEITADASGVDSGISKAKQSINSLGAEVVKENSRASKSIDAYVKNLQTQHAIMGMSSRDAELYKLAMRGASDSQLKAAETSLKLSDAYTRGVLVGDKLKASFIAFGAIAATSTIAAAVAFDQLVKKAGDFQDMAEKTGDTAENIASLAVSAAVGGVQMETIVSAANKLTKGLTGVDDESAAAGAAIASLGLNLADFKNLKPADQMESVAKALNGFQDGASKSAVAMALFGKSGAEMLPFLKELGAENGRQAILTQQQIQLADEYADKSAKLSSQISIYAQSIAIDMVPSVNDLKGAAIDSVKAFSSIKGSVDSLDSSAIQDFADVSAKALGALTLPTEWLAKKFTMMGIAAAGLADIAISPISQAAEKYDALDARLKKIDEQSTYYENVKSRIENRAPKKTGYFYDPFEAEQIKPSLDYKGTVKDSKSTAAAEAKSQLALDLEQIKSASAKTTSIYANSEKIMEAMHSASLINDQEYYASKLAFLSLNSQAQEAELQAEIARMQKQQLTGKDRLDNEKNIAEAEAKLAKVRGDSTANIEVVGIQQSAAMKKVEQAYKDATEAAQAYLDTVQKQYDRQIAGVGRGDKANARNADVNKIEDTLTAGKQSLDRDKRNGLIDQEKYDQQLAILQNTYDQEIAMNARKNAAIDSADADWINGATRALENYSDTAADVATQTANTFTNAFQGMEDALVSFVQTGKIDFSSLANSMIADIARMQIKAAMAPITSGIGDWIKGAFGSTASTSSSSGFLGNGITLGGYHTGGIIGSEPTFTRSVASSVFSGAPRFHTGGIAGDEVPIIAKRGEGVFTAGQMAAMGNSQSQPISIVVNNTASDKVETSISQRNNNGKIELELMVAQVIAADQRKNGPITQGFSQTFGMSRAV